MDPCDVIVIDILLTVWPIAVRLPVYHAYLLVSADRARWRQQHTDKKGGASEPQPACAKGLCVLRRAFIAANELLDLL